MNSIKRVLNSTILLMVINFSSNNINAQKKYYNIIRYNDTDFSYLKNDTIDNDFFRPIKYIPFSKKGNSFLTLGGELRENYQIIKNENWGDIPPNWKDNDGFIWHRLMFHADTKVNSNIRIFAQLKNTEVISRSGGPRNVIDKDNLSLHQAFVDFNFTIREENLVIRVGRQEMNLGWGKLVSVREGPNNRQTFEGVSIHQINAKWKNQLFYLNSVDVQEGVFDEHRLKNEYIFGLYTNYNLSIETKTFLDLYYIGSHRNDMLLANINGVDKRQTLGTRLSTFKSNFIYDLELIYQFGKYHLNNIQAYSAVGMLGYEWSKIKIKPKISLYGGITSGDKSGDSKMGTFNALYPRPPFTLGLPFGPLNTNAIQADFSILPTKGLRTSVGFLELWRNSKDDGLYTPGITPIRPNGNFGNVSSYSKYITGIYYIDTEYFVGRHWQLNMQYVISPEGSFIKETGLGKTINYLMLQSTFRF